MMFVGHLITFFVIRSVLGENCDNLGILLYEDLGCTPDGSQPCPTKYSCTGLEPTDDKCFFRGKIYEDGELVDDRLSSPSCDKACSCSKYGGKAKFTCAVLDCPESLGVPTKPGCYRSYSLEECCSTGQKCPPFGNNQKCLVDGTEYKEGEQFYPQKTCLHCVCQKGFKGKYEEPFCKRQSCAVQLKGRSGANVQNRCAPLYGKKSNGPFCCPNGWICPDGSENIKGDVRRDNICKFGDKTLKVGQWFEKINVETSFGEEIEKITCECVIPPLLTCNKV